MNSKDLRVLCISHVFLREIYKTCKICKFVNLLEIILNLLALKSININKQNSNKNKQYKKSAKFLLQTNLKSNLCYRYL